LQQRAFRNKTSLQQPLASRWQCLPASLKEDFAGFATAKGRAGQVDLGCPRLGEEGANSLDIVEADVRNTMPSQPTKKNASLQGTRQGSKHLYLKFLFQPDVRDEHLNKIFFVLRDRAYSQYTCPDRSLQNSLNPWNQLVANPVSRKSLAQVRSILSEFKMADSGELKQIAFPDRQKWPDQRKRLARNLYAGQKLHTSVAKGTCAPEKIKEKSLDLVVGVMAEKDVAGGVCLAGRCEELPARRAPGRFHRSIGWPISNFLGVKGEPAALG
jgi:hypothetical protein